MIAVIADDFTGAAEIAGIGLRYSLKVKLVTTINVDTDADLIVVCTDSRSLNSKEAQAITSKAVQTILLQKPDWVYKKIDSVFRGHVLDELEVQMRESGLKKALVIGANPSLGRTIKEGRYFINEKPISETSFSSDPEFAITDSSVVKMIRGGKSKVYVLKHTDNLPADGVVIGEASSSTDLTAWVSKTTNSLLAGAADFFIALLDQKYKAHSHPEVHIEFPHLYISGTAFDRSRAFIREIEKKSGCVAYLPSSILKNDAKEDKTWLDKVTAILKSKQKIVIAIGKVELSGGITALALRIAMAKTVKQIIKENEVRELFIEGGSTAAAILNELDITTLEPVHELKRGVVKMKTVDMYITVKPGSYELPEQIRKLYS